MPKCEQKCRILVITSLATFSEVKRLFKKKKFFGLNKAIVSFFVEGQVPSLDQDGKIMMKSMHELVLMPCGAGQILQLLSEKEEARAILENTDVVQIASGASEYVLSLHWIGLQLQKKHKVGALCTKKQREDDEKAKVLSKSATGFTLAPYSNSPKPKGMFFDNLVQVNSKHLMSLS